MRTLPACLLLVLALAPPAVRAAPPSVQERLERRAETRALVEQGGHGGLPVPTPLARPRLLREEALLRKAGGGR